MNLNYVIPLHRTKKLDEHNCYSFWESLSSYALIASECDFHPLLSKYSKFEDTQEHCDAAYKYFLTRGRFAKNQRKY